MEIPGKALLFLIDAWSSAAGGVQTVNRELCLALGRLAEETQGEKFDLVCLCKACTTEEQDEALRSGVMLTAAKDVESEKDDPKVLTMLSPRPRDQMGDVVCVVGHSRFTGLAARKVRDQFFPKAKVVIIHHMDPDELGALKDGSAVSERRSQLEREIAFAADIVFAVGPRLERKLKDAFTGHPGTFPSIHRFLCGMYEDAPVRSDPPPHPVFLFIGRVEDPELKGADLFAEAAGELVKHWHESWDHEPEWEPRFVVRGFPRDESNAKAIFRSLRGKAKERAGRDVIIVKKTFTTDVLDLRADIMEASAVVTPSRVEGFGLAAMEALSFGVPAIVAEDSGVGELFKSALQAGTKARYVVDTRGEQAVESLASALRYFAVRPERSREIGRILRDQFVSTCSWSAAAKQFCEIVIGPIVISPPAFFPATSMEVREFLLKEVQHVNNECRWSCGRPIGDIFVDPTLERWEAPGTGGARDQSDLAEVRGKGQLRQHEKWSDVVENLTNTVVLGAPGAGKTLCHLWEVERRCLSAISALETDSAPVDDIEFGAYFHANELASRLEATTGSLFQTVVGVLSERHGPVSDDLKSWLRRGLQEGRILLAVDALDEIGPELPKRTLLARLSGLGPIGSGCPLLTSSRSAPYDPSSLPGAVEWCLQPFSPKQLRLAAQKWLPAYPQAVESFYTMAKNSPPLLELLTSPVLLMLACRVWETALRNSLQVSTFGRRSEIYDPILGCLRERWIERATQKGKRPTLLEQEAFPAFAEAVAWALWRPDPRRTLFPGGEIAGVIKTVPESRALDGRPDLFDDLCHSGLLTKAGPKGIEAPYSFLHRTLLEYLAAKYIASRASAPSTPLDPVREARPYFDDVGAHEFLWMLVGTLADASLLVQAIVEWADERLQSPGKRYGSEDPGALVIDCLFEFPTDSIGLAARERAWQLITSVLDLKQRRKRQGEWTTLADWSLIYRAMRAVETHEGATSRAPGILQSLHQIHLVQHGAPAADVIGDAVADLHNTLGAGLKSVCPVVRWGAIWAVTAIKATNAIQHEPEVAGIIEELLNHDPCPHVRSIAARALAEVLGNDALSPLETAIEGADSVVAAGAAIGLSRLSSDEAVAVLKNKAHDLLKATVSSERDRVLIAVIGALESLVSSHRRDDDLAGIFLRALTDLQPSTKTSAASALGKIHWKFAWQPLKNLVEQAADGEGHTEAVRGSACYACDQLAAVLENAQLREAEKLFRRLLSNTRETAAVRRPASSGLVKMMGRGYRSIGLVNDLLLAAHDNDERIAKNSLIALLLIKPEEILEDAILLLGGFGPRQRQLLCVAVRDRPSGTGFSLLLWLLDNDSNPRVIASTLDAVGEALKKARESKLSRVPEGFGHVELHVTVEDLGDVQVFDVLAQRCLSLSNHGDPSVVASCLKVLDQLARLKFFRKGGPLAERRQEMLRLVRALLGHHHWMVQASACVAIAALGESEDLALLEAIVRQSSSKKVSGSAKYALRLLRQRLSVR